MVYPNPHSSERHISEEKWFVRPKSMSLKSMSVSQFIPEAHHAGLVLSHVDHFLTFRCAARDKSSEMVFPNAHSGERRFRGEVVCSLKKHVARVDVGIALHTGSATRGARSQPCRPLF